VNLLLDTHLLLWAAGHDSDADMLPGRATALIEDESNILHFSPASIWEVAIKSALGRRDFDAEPHRLRRGLLDNGYAELAITGEHAAGVARLPSIHKDPFDRMLISQAICEGITLLTADAKVASYDGPILRV
jgi:PIN domain nuclease of toxin-antitoxin system